MTAYDSQSIAVPGDENGQCSSPVARQWTVRGKPIDLIYLFLVLVGVASLFAGFASILYALVGDGKGAEDGCIVGGVGFLGAIGGILLIRWLGIPAAITVVLVPALVGLFLVLHRRSRRNGG